MPNAIYHAVERILLPLARLLVSQGVSYGQVSEMLKAAMVREALARAEALEEQAAGGVQEVGAVGVVQGAMPEQAAKSAQAAKLARPSTSIRSNRSVAPSDSRICIATGVHRKDVRRLRALEGIPPGVLEGSTAAQVIAKWLSLGSPPPLLKRRGGEGETASFEAVVQSISTDIRPRAVLDELLAREVVTEETDGQLRVHADRLVLNQGLASLAEYLGMNVRDHLAVAVHNLSQEGDAQLDRCVHYHGVSEQVANQLQTLAREQAMQALTTVNNAAQQLIKEKKNRGSYRFNFGAYFRQEAMK